MVDVGVRQQNEVYGCGVEGREALVLGIGFISALEHAAVNQKSCSSGFHQSAGAGDFTSGAEEN
jgi:hypothetical protein